MSLGEKKQRPMQADFNAVSKQEAQLLVKQHKTDLDGKEKREFRRFNIKLGARFLTSENNEFKATVSNISIGGAAFKSTFIPKIGETLIIYIEEIGRVVGIIARVNNDGFATRFKQNETQLNRMAVKISWLVDHFEFGAPNLRRSIRMHASNSEVPLVLPGDIEITCTIVDFSLTGAGIKTTARPPIGTRVRVSKMSGKVVRHLDDGIAIEFCENTENNPEFDEFQRDVSIRDILRDLD